jgi:hypothetical protein
MSNFGIFLILVLQKKIPIFLIKNIYEDHFEANIIYQKLISIIDSEESKKLNILPLFNFIKNIFHKNIKNPTIIPYICKNHKIFRIYYINHYVKIIKYFILMDIDHSFTASILMAIYH